MGIVNLFSTAVGVFDVSQQVLYYMTRFHSKNN